MTYVVRVSKQGINVLGTAGTVPNNLIFDSTLNTFKIITSGTVLGTIAHEATGTISVAHGQTYTPAVNGFVRKLEFAAMPSGTVTFLSGGFSFDSISANGTNILFAITNGPSLGTVFTCSYYVFEVPL